MFPGDFKSNKLIRKRMKFSLLILFSFIFFSQGFSEGTKEIRPASTDNGYVILDPGWSPFATYGCPVTSRLNIRICNVGEKVYFGFNQPNRDVRFRIKDSSGVIVVPQTTVPSSGAGYISSYNRAVAGPSAIIGTSGYDAMSFTATQTGDYYIEFLLPNGNPRREFDLFDITVASAANVPIKGRIWSQSWMLSTKSFTNAFKGLMYIYADDGIVTSLNFNGMQPYVFVLNANMTGTGNTGNPDLDRQSKVGSSTYPKYKVFLNDPDPSCFPTGQFGKITAPTTVSGCPPTNFCLNVFVDKPGFAQIFLDLNGIPGHQPGTRDRAISAAVTPPQSCIPWDGRDGLGNRVTTAVSIRTRTDFYNGLTHIPLYDVEGNPNGYIVNLVRPLTGTPIKLYWDDRNIPAANGNQNLDGCNNPCHKWTWYGSDNTSRDYGNRNTVNTWWYADSTSDVTDNMVPPGIVVDADTRISDSKGNDSTICGSVGAYTLSGLVQNAGGGMWTTTGTGTFSDVNNMNGTYTPSAADKAAGSVKIILVSTGNGACPAIRDTMTLRFQAIPSVLAGPAVTVCSNNPQVALNGSVQNASGVIWSSSGTGTFTPAATNLVATYIPSTADIASGNVSLTLTSTGNGVCPATQSVTKLITIEQAPTVNAGPDQTVCAGGTATLAASATNYTTITWSGGNGTFSPNNATLNATYTPHNSETSGSVTLTLTATKVGCATVTDQVNVIIQPALTVNAGADISVCKNNPTANLSGTSTNASTYTWSGGAGTFSNANALTTTYTATTAETNAGPVTLTLTASKSGCPSVTDQVQVSFTPSPVSTPGPGSTVCANNPNVTLNGSVTGATGGRWTGGCGTFIPNDATLNATYIPCASEVSSGLISLTLTTTGNGTCNAVSNSTLILVEPSPVANAGSDKSVCENNPNIVLSGTTTDATSSTWSGGAGLYQPSATDLNITYIPTSNEIASGSVVLTLTANRTTCNSHSDQVTINFTPAPIVNAGPDQSVCANNSVVNLNGTVSNAGGVLWSGGAGTFSPNASTLNAKYTPTAGEIATGTVTLTLSSTGNGNCNQVQDEIVVTITKTPTIDAGTNQTVCANNPAVNLSGKVTIAAGGTWSGGSGIITPNIDSLNIRYVPSAAEIAAGTATLTFTTRGNGNCIPVSDQVSVTITPAPTVNAGADITVCADDPSIALSGSVTVATGGTWSGGAGTFTPNNTTLVTTYNPTIAEITARTVTLTLTSSNNGNCNAVSDNIRITIHPAPSIDAGPNQVVCGSVSSVQLTGVVTTTGGQWETSGSGTFNPTSNKLITSYIPSAADITAGKVTLTLTTTGNGRCKETSDQMTISFTTVPTVNAGADQVVCANDLPIKLAGSGSPATWSGGTGTFTPDANTPNAHYTPTASEISSGTVTLTLTTVASGACPVVSDQVKITIPPAPIANAGSDFVMCGNLTSYTLNGTINSAATGGFWTTTGTGTFTPNASTLNATYTPSTADRTAGSVYLILSTTGTGICSTTGDTMQLTISPRVTVNAGPDQTLCASLTGIQLNGTASNAAGITWTTSGTGTFTPNATTLLASYIPSSADTAAKSVTLTITSVGTPTCASVTDNVTIQFTPAPVIIAGADQTLCADVASVQLAGYKANTNGARWSTSGTGTFSPSFTALNASYIPSEADKGTSVTLTLSSTGSGICNGTSDDLIINLNPTPTVNAGPDQTVCADTASINLNGTVTVATGSTWTSDGTGTFTNPGSPATTYTPSAADISKGIVAFTLTTNSAGACSPVSDIVAVVITPAPTVNAGTNRNVCANNTTLALNGSVTVASGGVWSGGTGIFVPSNSALNATYNLSASEISSGSVTLTLTTTGNGLCKAKTSQMTIDVGPAPTVNAGPDQTICEDLMGVNLAGSYTGTSLSGVEWTSSGSGAFFPNQVTPNATYVPSEADRSSGTVRLLLTTTGNGNCNAVVDTMNITITPAPTVNAGADKIVCGNNAEISLQGDVTVATGGYWRSSGTGTFTPDTTSLNASYLPSALDISGGTVTLTLISSGNGLCKPVSDQLAVTITPAPTVNAGPDRTVCANNSKISLNGVITIATGATWSTTGSGSFSPDPNSLNATYSPSEADNTAGSVSLILTSTGNGDCNAVSDTVNITITPAPTAEAGTDQTICATGTGAPLNGTITVATGGSWKSTGTGTFSPNAYSAIATYVPSASDTINGKVTLTLTTTGNGNCTPVSDSLNVTIQKTPLISAGPDETICADKEFLQQSGSVANATGATWTTSGSGTFTPDNNTLDAIYNPSVADLSGTSLVLTLTSTGNGVCSPVSDQKIYTINPVPTVNAGADQSLCANNSSVVLNGVKTIATGVMWTSSGDGTFSPDNTSLLATYIPSADDIAGGSVAITLTTTGNGACNATSDQLNVTITPAPTITAGPDQTICANNSNIHLSGDYTVATGGTWTSTGTGTFSPSADDKNATYKPSVQDITNGSVTFTFTTTGNANCLAVSDEMIVTITPAPTVNVGPTVNICATTTGVPLNGIITNATGGIWASGSGEGTFSPSNTDLNATFMPSEDQIATGKANLTLTTTGFGNCKAVSANLVINISPLAVVNAGPDVQVCAGAPGIALSGTVKKATGGIWTTSGTGSFVPSPTALNATYVPSAAENVNGSTILLTLTSTGNGFCTPVTDEMTINFKVTPVYAGPDQQFCSNALPVQLNGSGNGSWSGGLGTFSDPNSLSATYTPTPEEIGTKVVLILTGEALGSCIAGKDTVVIDLLRGPSIDVGADLSICENNPVANVSAIYADADGIVWKTEGNGTFTSTSSTSTTYTASAQDITTGVIRLYATTINTNICKPEADTLTLTFTPAPEVDAGNDITSCANAGAISLNGIVKGATGGTWSIISGSGSFANAAIVSTSYTPSSADITNGSVTLRLSSNPTDNCSTVSDDLIINIGNAPTVDAGDDETICADANSVVLSGSVQIASGGHWTTSGTGKFSPNTNTLNATYIPSADDINNMGVTLTLTTTGNGTCAPVSESKVVNITPAPTVSAGPSQTVCADNTTITLSGTRTVALGSIWSSTGGGSFADPNSLNTTYTPTAAEKAAGSINLTLTTTNNGLCQEVSSTVSILITPIPVVNAGLDQSACVDVNTYQIAGNIKHAPAGIWTTSGSGSFDDANALNAVYTPSSADKTNGNVTLTFASAGNPLCNVVSDQLVLTFTPAPTINAGSDHSICADKDTIHIAGSVTIAAGGRWSSNGDGYFAPSANSLGSVYYLGETDKGQTAVTLSIVSTDNGTCNAVTDNLIIDIAPKPVVDAGADQTICAGQANATLAGSVLHATGGVWSTTGTGTFTNGTSLTTTYIPSEADNEAGGVILTLNSTGNGLCNAVSDFIVINVIPSPSAIVNAGADIITCKDLRSVKLSGFVSNAGGGIWSTSGTGTFTPDVNTLNASYTPSLADKAAGNIVLTLTTANNGQCSAVSDDMSVTLTPIPVVTAGSYPDICGLPQASIALNGNVTIATGGIWKSSGSGVFAVDAATLNATYFPSSLDIQNGVVGLTLTSTGNGTCNPVMQTTQVKIIQPPVVDAGTDKSYCSDITTLVLRGTSQFDNGVTWTGTGTGTFNPNNKVTSIYSPSDADKAIGKLVVTLSAAGKGSCPSTSNTAVITILPAPEADAGPDQTTCNILDSYMLKGVHKNSTSGAWFTSGTGSFDDFNKPDAIYYPSDADKSFGSVDLVFITTGNGICKFSQDTMTLYVDKSPIVNAGTAMICAIEDGAQLAGDVKNANGGKWSTSGTGVFAINSADLNAKYYPTLDDYNKGQVVLKLTSFINGACPAVSDSTVLKIDPMPIADAGRDQFVCRGTTIILEARTSPGITYEWRNNANTIISTDPVFSLIAASDSAITLIVKDYKGCPASDSINVGVFDFNNSKFDMLDHYCYSDTLIIHSLATGLPAVPGQYQWYRDGIILNSENRPAIAPQSNGLFRVVYEYGNCSTEKTTNVTNPPALTRQPVLGCIGTTLPITIVSDVNNVDYSWITGEQGTDLNSINVPVAADTNYFRATVTDILGCNSTDSVMVIGIERPIVNISDAVSCTGQTVTLAATPSNLDRFAPFVPDYAWFKDNIDMNLSDDTLLVKESALYVVSLTIGQCTTNDSAHVLFNALPVSHLPEFSKICPEYGAKVTLDAGYDPNYKYKWTSVNPVSDKDTSKIDVPLPGTYFVLITNKENCSITDTILVRDLCNPRLDVPNVFTPGKSDTPENQSFRAYGKYVVNYKMMIFNRWGEIIFETGDKDEAWDGYYKGQLMPIGTYPYIITYEGEDPESRGPYKKEGKVTLLK